MAQENSPVLVTGATGFVGINIVKYLAEHGRSVVGLDIVNPDHLIDHYLQGLNELVKWVQVDLADAERVQAITDQYTFDKIIHAAVFTPASQDVERAHPRRILTSNLMGTVNMLELARSTKVSRFVYASSSGVYGSTPSREFPVDPDSLQPFTETGGFSGFYGITKITSEKLTERYGQLFPMTTTSVRIAAPYGPMDRSTWCRTGIGYTYRLLKLILTENKRRIRVKGLDYTRDRTYVMDTAQGLVAAVDAPAPLRPRYNVSSGVNVSVDEILRAIRQATGYSLEWEEVEDERDADCIIQGSRRGPLSIDTMRRDLNFHPRYTIQQGIHAYIEWWCRVVHAGLWTPS